MSKYITRWYRNSEGIPKVSLRDTFSKNNIENYKQEIYELGQVSKDIKLFYNKCSILTGSGLVSGLINTRYSNEILESINDKFTVVIKARQIGFSITSAIISLYYTQILNKSVVIISKDNMMDKIRMIYRYLPEHLKYGVCKMNKKEIKFNNGCRIKVSNSIISALGWSPELTICDEFDWLSNKQKDICKYLIPTIAARLNDQLIIGSTIDTNNKGVSMLDLITNTDYFVYNFKFLNLDEIDLIVKQFIREKKINDILNEI